MKIAAWFKNLRKDSPRFLATEFYSEEMKSSFNQSEENRTFYLEQIAQKAKVDIERMQFAVAAALAERKTCSHQDFLAQLHLFMDAHAAALHQKWLGAGANEATTKVVSRNFEEERAKLLFLAFEEIDISSDAAEQKVEAYIAKSQAAA
jgi:hypothetical protein